MIHGNDGEIYRQKIEFPDQGYRALFDIREGKVKVFGIIERPPEGYSEETLSKKGDGRSGSF